MRFASIVSILDRLSIETVLTNSTGSLIGFLCTLAFVIICLVVLMPSLFLYFRGVYFESQFLSHRDPKGVIGTGRDLILAIAFRNKKTHQYANHTMLLQRLDIYGAFKSYSQFFKTELIPCRPELFLDAINPTAVEDCIMMPPNLKYDISTQQSTFSTLQMFFGTQCEDPFRCNSNSNYFLSAMEFIGNLTRDYYWEYIFNSKVLNQRGTIANQIHKIYSTEWTSPDGVSAYLTLTLNQKRSFVDDSINPWWNNKTSTNIFWDGVSQGAAVSQNFTQSFGLHNKVKVSQNFYISYRYYKKLDFIIGMVGGAVFLIFLLFWVPCSYFNRFLQKIRNAEELFLDKNSASIQSFCNLQKVRFPWHFFVTQFKSGNKYNQIIERAEHEVDIVQFIKKLKVTEKNLKLSHIDMKYTVKNIDFSVQEQQTLELSHPLCQNYKIIQKDSEALASSPNSKSIYETNPAALALIDNTKKQIETLMKDEVYDKMKIPQYQSWKKRLFLFVSKVFKHLDVFGAKPMLYAEPQASSCWGLILTFAIIALSALTFALTIYNMNSVKLMTSYKNEHPSTNNYVIKSGQSLSLAFCVTNSTIDQLVGVNKTAKLTFFKNSQQNGYEELKMERMGFSQFEKYFQLEFSNFYKTVQSQFCFKPVDGQSIAMGGTYSSINEAYLGLRLDPFCSGTPAECSTRKSQTASNFLKFINSNTSAVYLSENSYFPESNRLISGIAQNKVPEGDSLLNSSLLRTATFFVSAIEILDDTSKLLLGQPPTTVAKTMRFSDQFDKKEQIKDIQSASPGYILEFRPNGQVQQIILRSYKIDFILGLIGGSFLFWYFFINFWAKFYNFYKVRAKLFQVLHSQSESGYDESKMVNLLYLLKVPRFIYCFSDLKEIINRVMLADEKIKRDLNYLTLIKRVDTCYRLSSSLFGSITQKDLSLIYCRQKINQAMKIQPRRKSQSNSDNLNDDFLDLDCEEAGNQFTTHNRSFLEDQQMNESQNLEKLQNLDSQKEYEPLFDPHEPFKKEMSVLRYLKLFDVFKIGPELTLNGERSVRSYFGAGMFVVLSVLIFIVCFHFLRIYADGTGYTISYKRLIDTNSKTKDKNSPFGQLSNGIHVSTGKNFKFALAFNKNNRHSPHNVSSLMKWIGMRILQFTVIKGSGPISETFEEMELEPCPEGYLDGFLGEYNDKGLYRNLTLGYCVPSGKSLSISGTPEDEEKKYFKLNIYNKYNNSTGAALIDSFFKTYSVTYYMSVPRMDSFSQNFRYEMTKFKDQAGSSQMAVEESIAFTKVIFTDNYYQRSSATFYGRTPKKDESQIASSFSPSITRNLTFYYDGILEHYVLDYPQAAELFGLVGGVIALFIFFFYNCVSSFNSYQMKYLIGKRLYTFDKTESTLKQQSLKCNKKKKKDKVKTKASIEKITEVLRKANNYNEFELLQAWVLSTIGSLLDNYNLTNTLRRVTLIIDKVQNDINLFKVYRNLSMFKDALNKRIKLAPSQQQQYNDVKLTNIYIKQIFNENTVEISVPEIQTEAKKHRFSSYEQIKIKNAINAGVDPEMVVGSKALSKAFNKKRRSQNQNQDTNQQSILQKSTDFFSLNDPQL